MPELVVHVSISAQKVADYYRGLAPRVVTRATNGQTVQFPTSVLHRYITTDGIHGRFRLVFDESNKFLRIEPVGAES